MKKTNFLNIESNLRQKVDSDEIKTNFNKSSFVFISNCYTAEMVKSMRVPTGYQEKDEEEGCVEEEYNGVIKVCTVVQ